MWTEILQQFRGGPTRSNWTYGLYYVEEIRKL